MSSAKPLSPQEVKDFIDKLITSPTKTLVIFFDASSGLGFTVVGKFKSLGEGVFSVQHENDDMGITEASSFNTTLSDLLRFPCLFTDPRDFKGNPVAKQFFEKEVRFGFGLTFAMPSRMLSILQLEESGTDE